MTMTQFEKDLIDTAAKLDEIEKQQMQEMQKLSKAADTLSFIELLRSRYGDEYKYIRKLTPKLYVVKKKDFGVMNAKGDLVLPANYICISPYPIDKEVYHAVNAKYQYGLLDGNMKELVPFEYKWIQFECTDELIRAMGKGGMGLLDIEGNVILEGFKEIWNFNEDFNDLVVKADGVRYSISRDNLQKIRQLVKHSRKPLTAKDIQDYLEYKEYLQHDEKFNAGIEVLSLVDFWKEKIR